MAGDGKGKMRGRGRERRTEERERQKIADIIGCLHTCWLSHFLIQGLGLYRGSNPLSLMSPALAGGCFITRATCDTCWMFTMCQSLSTECVFVFVLSNEGGCIISSVLLLRKMGQQGSEIYINFPKFTQYVSFFFLKLFFKIYLACEI